MAEGSSITAEYSSKQHEQDGQGKLCSWARLLQRVGMGHGGEVVQTGEVR